MANHTSEDLISRLPDSLVTHILSFIDTKSAVATTVLSKRWNGLWISVPSLDFGTYKFHGRADTEFENFVDRVLHLNNVMSVESICLEFPPSTHVDRLHSWLTCIAKRHARKIMLNILGNQLDCFPVCFFNQKNLVELQLANFNSKIPQTVLFPSLKSIDFQGFRLTEDDSLKNLMCGCPVLRDLILYIGECDNAPELHIRSSTLRTLEICGSTCLIGVSYYQVVIDTPNVTHLTLAELYGGVTYEILNVSSLVNVNLLFEGDGEELQDLLRKISHASEFYLSFTEITSFIGSLANMPTFQNLIKLTLDLHLDEHWECLPRVFHCTPNLTTFVLLMLCYKVSSHYFTWHEPIEVPRCFLTCLESVNVQVCIEEGDPEEDGMQMISYILKNAAVLKNLHIEDLGCMDLKQENECLKTLLTFQRGSAACQVFYKAMDVV